MTVIAALAHEGRVWMGADAMSTETDYEAKTQSELVYPKVIEIGDVLVGLAGEHIFHTLMRFGHPPAPAFDQCTIAWAQSELFPWLTAKVEELEPRRKSMSMLIARGSDLFLAEPKNVDLVPVREAAIGTGAPYALGALTALKDVSILVPRDRMAAAIRAACHHDPYCGGRVDVLVTSAETPGLVDVG